MGEKGGKKSKGLSFQKPPEQTRPGTFEGKGQDGGKRTRKNGVAATGAEKEKNGTQGKRSHCLKGGGVRQTGGTTRRKLKHALLTGGGGN